MKLHHIPSHHVARIVLLAAAASTILTGPIAAAEDAWQPPPPMPENFDWMQMTSLEWLKGELISMYDGSVEFDSDEFDVQTVDWEDVKELRSSGTMQVAFEDGAIAVGQVFIDRTTVRVMGTEDRQYPRSGVLSITAGAPKERNRWSIKASLGANIREGNTEQLETTSKANLIRRTPKNRIHFDWLSTFNRTDGDTAADNQRLTAGWNRFLSKRFYWTPVQGEWYRDPFTNIAHRWTLGMGLGYEILDTSKISWDVTGGLSYQTTTFDSVEEGEDESTDTPALTIGTVYDQELTKWMDFVFNYSFFIVDEESGTYTHHLVTGLEFELTRVLDFDVSFIWDRIEDPRPDEDGIVPEQDDYRLVFFLGFDL